MAAAGGDALKVVVQAPPGLEEALLQLAAEAKSRYGVSLIGVHPNEVGVQGWVAIPAQAEAVTAIMARLWPAGSSRILVLSGRRARFGLHPQAAPLEVWRGPPAAEDGREPERTTQLLPGDPPAEVVAVRQGSFLVRAPGEALGWVAKGGEFRIGPPGLAAGKAPTDILREEGEWSPDQVIATALAHLGRPYVWGGTGAQGMDCSGLIWRAFLTAGILLPKNSRAQRKVGRRVPRSELRRADLLAAVSRGPRRTSHVALALSSDEVVHACSELMAVRREPLSDFEQRYRLLTVRRIAGASSRAR